jgi:hypothetical protein
MRFGLGMFIRRCDLVPIASRFPPRQILSLPIDPLGFGDPTNPRAVVLQRTIAVAVLETDENRRHVDQANRATAYDLAVAAVLLSGGVVNDTRRDGVQMHIRNNLPEGVVRIDDARTVPALP